jgi:hypothetical protein
LPYTQTGKNTETPTICFGSRDTHVTRTMHKSLDLATRAFGAWMYLDQHTYADHDDPDAEMQRIGQRCLTDELRRTGLGKRHHIETERDAIMKLRLELESEQWSPELESNLGRLRRKLARTLLALSSLHLQNITREEQLAISRSLGDEVSAGMDRSELGLTGKERTLPGAETKQTGEEQKLVQREETKGIRGRRVGKV